MSTAPRILVVGAANMDVIIEVPRLPLEGETLIGSRLTQAPGGKGANQAVAVARLGGQASFCGRVGEDDWGRFVIGSLATSGVNTQALSKDHLNPTGAAIILVEPSGRNQITAVAGANLAVSPADVEKALKAGHHDALMLTLETPLETVRQAIRLGVESGLPVILDAAPPANHPLHALRGITVISPNETEAQALTGVKIGSLDDARQAADLLLTGTSAKHVVMKLGDKGALILDEAGDRWIEPFHVHAVDTTACGDAFTAAMTLRLCAGDTIDDAVRYGCAAGAATAMRPGAQASLPDADDVKKVMQGDGTI